MGRRLKTYGVHVPVKFAKQSPPVAGEVARAIARAEQTDPVIIGNRRMEISKAGSQIRYISTVFENKVPFRDIEYPFEC